MVKNSRFIAEAIPVADAEAARELWKQQKRRYDNGGHIVFAFITGPQGNIMGCSDDGEPSGTAGKPTLAVLKGSGLTNTIITTARWFGGTKLGTGGLVHAYTACAQAALDGAQITELVAVTRLAFTLPYPCYDQIKRRLQNSSFQIESEDFTDKITLTGTVHTAECERLKLELRELSNGAIVFADLS